MDLKSITTLDEMSDLDSQHSRQSSTYKMSLDSDDSASFKSTLRDLAVSNWATTVERINIREDTDNPKKTKSYDFRERRDPERRSVTRRSSLLPKSKALLRVIDQADEDTHLADLEMRREHETTALLNKEDTTKVRDVPAASWTKVPDTTLPLYTCSKLNPEIEMTNFQLENISSNYKSIKRKVSEDRFEPYATSLKRRAVSPSVSLNGSPTLSSISSPPNSFLIYSPSNNAASRLKPGSFNLQDASGGLSRMSLSE